MRRVKTNILTFLCVLSFSSVFAQSLGPDYNLGRITGGPMGSQDLEANQTQGYLQAHDGIGIRFGKESRYQIDWSGALFYQDQRVHPEFAMIPYEIRATVRPDYGHQVDFRFVTPVFSYLSLDGKSQSGLSDSLKSPLSYALRYDMLTREGHIDIRPYEYEWTFRRGPILDPGEFRNHVEFRTDVSDLAEDATDYYQFDWGPKFGLFEGVQLGLNYWIGWVDRQTAWKSLHWDLETRFQQFYLQNTLSAQSDKFPELFESSHNAWEIRGGMVLGNRGLNFQNVNGNWDHYFNPMLGFGQILVEGFHWQNLNKDIHQKNAGGTVLLGALPFLTTGASAKWWNHKDTSQNIYKTLFHLNLANVSVRKEGPSDVQAMEYRTGYIPRAGEFQLYMDLALPFHSKGYSFSGIPASDTLDAIPRTLTAAFYSNESNQGEWAENSNPFFNAKLRIGISDHLFFGSETAYFTDGFQVEGSLHENAIWESLHVGIHFMPYFVTEGGMTLTHSSETDLGPVFLRILHTF